MKPYLPLLVFAIASVILSWNLWSTGIASGYIDPLMHFGAQDEATYTREAITMAREGGWMTPTFLGRWVFEKPPLLTWLSAVSMKMFGIGPFTARLGVVFAGALICALVFVMVGRERTLGAAIAAAMMALSSQVLFILSRHAMTDILLAASGMIAFAVLLRDPELRSTAAFAGFVIAAAAGFMAKSVAGVLVLAVMMVVVGLGRGPWVRATLASVVSLGIASPWFLYHFILHREWFLADMGFQILTVGSATHQNTSENHVWFYIVRLLYSDLLPLLLALTAIPAIVAALRRRETAALLAASYFLLYGVAILLFRFSSEQYLCWWIPSLVLIAGLYSPLLQGRAAAVAVISAVAIAFVVKVANPDRDFGVSLRPGTTIAAAPVLSRYCAEHRASDLYVLGVDDEFYSAVLPLHRVHYGFMDPMDLVAREHPHLLNLGILIPAAEFSQLDTKLPVYRDRLRTWGLESTLAVGTGIAAHRPEELLRIIYDHPESDFLVARTVLHEPERVTTHRVAFANDDFSLLESRQPAATETPAWTCEM
jgi:4-amino-4-deoxy-L-arabinose transferase-like glycosyltransferase